jgi:hypothetical protein
MNGSHRRPLLPRLARPCLSSGGRVAAIGCGTIGDMSDLIAKLVPILHVKDPSVERRFYEQLGLRTTYEGPEYPGLSRSVMTSSSSG